MLADESGDTDLPFKSNDSEKIKLKAKSHKHSKGDEEMNKILTALKYFNDKNNKVYKDDNILNTSDVVNTKPVVTTEDNDKDSPLKESESRPKSSRRKRSSKQRKKSGNSNGGNNSALGFHPNVKHNPLVHNIENLKNPHNRSVNIVSDSPKVKKRKVRKGRVSPNNFAVNYTRKYPQNQPGIHHSKRVSLDQEELAMISRSRPKSAKQKKKLHKAKISKINNSFAGCESYDKEEKSLVKFMKKHHCSFKARSGLKTAAEPKKRGSKLKQYKNVSQKGQNILAYENLSYIEDL